MTSLKAVFVDRGLFVWGGASGRYLSELVCGENIVGARHMWNILMLEKG